MKKVHEAEEKQKEASHEEKHEAHKEDGMMMAKHEAGAGDAAPAPADAAPAASPDHPDAEQDIDLFKQLISQYLGADHGQSEEECMKMAKETYHEGMASGMSHEESMKCAGYGLKAAHMLTKKEHAMKQAADSALQVHPVDGSGSLSGTPGLAHGAIGKTKEAGLPPSKADQSHSAQDDGGNGKEAHKESQTIIRLTAEKAKLQEALNKLQKETHLNTLLEGCGMSKKTTNAFRQLVSDKKTPLEVEAAWKVYKEAFTESAPVQTNSGFIFSVEKQTPKASRAVGSDLGFEDCVAKKEI